MWEGRRSSPFPTVRNLCEGDESFQITVAENVECDLGRKGAEDINTRGSLDKTAQHASSGASALWLA